MLKFVGRTVCWAFACCLFATSAAFAQSTTTEPVGHNLYLMTTHFDTARNYMNNLVSVGPDGVLLVDTIDAGQYSFFRSGLDRISPSPVQVLIDTQWHHDHTGLNADFVNHEHTGTILAHWRTGGLLSAEQSFPDMSTTVPALPPEAQPTDPVFWGKLLHQNGESIALVPTLPNAHSGTDLLVFFLRSNVVHMGDIYFGNAFPFIDRARGGTLDGTIQSCRLVLSVINDQTVVVPSHGPVGDRSALAEYTEMLETVRHRVHALVEQGLTEPDVLSAKPLADLDERWGQFFMSADSFTTIVYRDLSRKSCSP